MNICSVATMRQMDKNATHQYGISQDLLMENAGNAAFQVIANTEGIKNNSFIIFCGTGNNGGDGLVVARKIHSAGGLVKIYIMGQSDHFKGAAKNNFRIIKQLPVELKEVNSLKSIQTDIAHSRIIVDAILGTGLTRNVEGIYKKIIRLINSSNKKVYSLDIPSGINGDNGQVMGVAINADYTISFGLAKLGNILYPGFSHCGELYTSSISFPPELYNNEALEMEINNPPPLPIRARDVHKGATGDVLFIAGAAFYYGAPYFSAMSFLKAGGGYARLAAPAGITPFIAAKASELIFNPQQETGTGSIAQGNEKALLALAQKADMVVLGPGLSLNQETQELVIKLVSTIKKPLLIDGDGLSAIAAQMDIIKDRRHPTILTPHLGEMCRITGLNIDQIRKQPVLILKQNCRKFNCHIVLKGAHSLIGDPQQRIFINMSGNPGMATAGSGDVLTGTIAAMFGLGLPVNTAVRAGVFIHGLAGDLAAGKRGEDGITAQDVLDFLPSALKKYRKSYNKTINHYLIPSI
jgi:hydroxyethylthiazole kinase-like uncharacterized protein yjeF